MTTQSLEKTMRGKTTLQMALAAAIIATGIGLSGCNQDSHPKGWSDQWYRKGQTPEEAAEWRRKHPDRGRPDETRPEAPIGSYPGELGRPQPPG